MVDSVGSNNVGSNIGSSIISTLGAGSGINTKNLTDQLVEVERSARQTSIDGKLETYESQISDYGLMRSAMATLQDSADLLSNTTTWNTKSATFGNSDAFIPVKLDEQAPVGDFSFTVEAIAQSQSFSSATSYTDPADSIGTGVLTFSFGAWDAGATTFSESSAKESVDIVIGASNNSLNGLRDAINGAGMGVQASIVNDGVSGYRLLITAESGLNNQLMITADEDAGAPGLANFSFDETDQNLIQQQAGADAHLTVNGLNVYRSSNSIDDVLDGFSFSLVKADPGAAVSVNIVEDKNPAKEAVRGFVDIYNEFLTAIEPAIGFNKEEDEYGSLNRDATAKSMAAQIRSMIASTVPGILSGYNILADVGILTEQDGSISLNDETFEAAFENNYGLVKNLFVPETGASSDKVTVTGYGPTTVPGSYEVVITQEPKQGYLTGEPPVASLLADIAASTNESGYYTGNTASPNLLTDLVKMKGFLTGGLVTAPLLLETLGTGPNDYDFNITIDGVASSAPISFEVKDYNNYGEMANKIKAAINADPNFSGIDVEYDTDHFVITSDLEGAASNVSVTDVGPNAASLGLSAGVSTAGTGGATDFSFTIVVDGITSGVITLPPGNYNDEDDVAAELENKINKDSTLDKAEVFVVWDTDHFVITSQATGSTSDVHSFAGIGALAGSLGLEDGTPQAGVGPYDFTLTVDGVTSGVINIAADTYADETELAQYMQTEINADSTLAANGAGVDVTWDGSEFVITSREYGASSSVSFNAVGANAGDLGLVAGTSTSGKDVQGTIGGEEAFGVGQVLLPALGSDAYGLKLLINPGVTTASVTVSFSRGFGDELSKLIDAYLGKGGVIATRETNLDKNIEDLDGDQERLDRRMTAYQERLQAQFLAMERIIAGISGSSSFLDNIADRLPNTAQR